MNQEAIDQIKADRDSALDLMGKAMDERDHFLKQRDALAAENKVLREALQKIASADPVFVTVGIRTIARTALTKEATNVPK